MSLRELFELEAHGPDTYVGIGLEYPWGGLYGGHIVAQALRAAAATVEPELHPHSLRAYFIRRGDPAEPVRYEVDRIRNGRSFVTRRVVARQAVGAILNLEASFQRDEPAPDVETVRMPRGVPAPLELPADGWSPLFERRMVRDAASIGTVDRSGAGRILSWMRVAEDLGDDRLLHCCALAYLSDDLPTDAVRAGAPAEIGAEDETVGASLDHTVWFHRPVRADAFHLHDFTSQGSTGNRGLAFGHVFSEAGIHVATVAQEVLIRRARHDPA